MLGAEQGNAGQYNLYAYCLDNPVNESDPSGYFVKSALKWLRNAVYKGIVLPTLKEQSGVITFGAGVRGNCAVSASADANLALQNTGDAALQITGGIGGGFIGVGGGASYGESSAPKTDDLNHLGATFGGSVGNVGFDWTTTASPGGGTTYSGGAVTVAKGITPVEIHFEVTYTYTLMTFNVHDLYQKIMAW